jgi:hypothetical protein
MAEELFLEPLKKKLMLCSSVTFEEKAAGPVYEIESDDTGLVSGERVPQVLSWGARCVNRCMSVAIRTLVASLALFIALSIPDFARIVSLIGEYWQAGASFFLLYFAQSHVATFHSGAAFSFTVSIIFPCACYLRLFWDRLSLLSIALNVAMIVIFSIVSVVGVIATFESPTD